MTKPFGTAELIARIRGLCVTAGTGASLQDRFPEGNLKPAD